MDKPRFDLAERTATFARDVRKLLREVKNFVNSEDSDQLVRSSGSVAANYLEADEAVSRKDFVHRIKICRKESRESVLWLSLLELPSQFVIEKNRLMNEGQQFVRIFQSIVTKVVVSTLRK